jgi:hypothetical protein
MGQDILKKTVSLFQNKDIRIARHSNLIFVCGGSLEKPSSRFFFKKAFNQNKKLEHLRLVVAESAYTTLKETNDFRFHNVSNFESLIADLSSCILIFLESPGSIAELGYFSASKKVSEKTLVVIDYRNQADNSFIMHGPIDRIDSIFNSRYKTRMPINNIRKHENEKEILEEKDLDFSLLFKKINDCTPVKRYREPFNYENIFRSKSYGKAELFFLLELINLYDVVRLKDIVNIAKLSSLSIGKAKILPLISILQGADLISIMEDEYNDTCFLRKIEYSSFFEVTYKAKDKSEYLSLYSTDQYNDIKMDVKSYYASNTPQILRLWENYINVTH